MSAKCYPRRVPFEPFGSPIDLVNGAAPWLGFEDGREPLDQKKIDGLVTSIKDTGFWDNILARKAKDGGFELTYGHHRLAALKKARIAEIDIPVRPLGDTTMGQIMALENAEEWRTNALIEQEAIRSIIEAFAEGRIELPKVKGQGQVRHAPSFIAPRPQG